MSKSRKRATIIVLLAVMLAVLGVFGITTLAPGPEQKVISESNTSEASERQSCVTDCPLHSRGLEGCTLEALVNELGPPEKLSIGLAPASGPEQNSYLAVFFYPTKGIDFSTDVYDSQSTTNIGTFP